MSKVHVKKGDTVYVLSGKDRGKTGKVTRVIPSEGKVVVEGVNVVTRHRKPQGNNINNAGIMEFEAPINSSRVMLVCPETNRPTKVGVRVKENGERVRYCKCSGYELDTLKKAKS